MACRKRLGSVLAAIILAVTCTAFADKTHTVAKGDTLFALASRFDTTVEQIKTVNELRSDVIQVGQVLKVPGVLERVGYTRHPAVPGETLVNDEFTVDAFETRIAAQPYGIVHIASHGEFRSDAKKSFLLTYDGKLDLDDLERSIKPSPV